MRSSAVQTSSGFVEGVFGSSYVTFFFKQVTPPFLSRAATKSTVHARVRKAFGTVSRTKETTQDGSSDLWK